LRDDDVISAITQLNSAGVNHRASTDRVREREPVLQTLAALLHTSSPSRNQTAAASLNSFSVFVASRYSCTQRSITVAAAAICWPLPTPPAASMPAPWG
jgi:hypothetical protein